MLIITILLIVGVTILFLWNSQRRATPCPFWLRWLVEIENPFTKNNRSSTIVRQLDIQPGMKVMDIGCGPGRVTIPLAEAVGKSGVVIAIDIQKEMLERAKKKAIAKDLHNIHFIRASMGSGELEQTQVERAVLVNVLGEIPEKRAALHEIFNRLQPGGILCVTEVMLDPQYQKRETVFALARAVGFQEKKYYGSKFAFSICFEKPYPNEG